MDDEEPKLVILFFLVSNGSKARLPELCARVRARRILSAPIRRPYEPKSTVWVLWSWPST
jgi:hypothetical protein